MKYKKGELVRLGFSEDGATAYCDVDFAREGPLGIADDGAITVKVHVPVKPDDTIQTLRTLAIDAGIQRLKAAVR